jgi:RND family efflux transporter MFP subunit
MKPVFNTLMQPLRQAFDQARHHSLLQQPRRLGLSATAVGVLVLLASLAGPWSAEPAVAADAPSAPKPGASAAAAKAALTVAVTTPQRGSLQQTLSANGSVSAWQEASVGAEAGGLRLAEVLVNVGDVVRKGQVLARFASEMVAAEQAQAKAAVLEAEASAAEAAANAARARELQTSGALSAQQVTQYLTGERTAAARLEAAKAAARVAELRLAQTQVLAPDSGVISARAATVGAVVGAGQELFRLVRQGRLEWRAEVPAAELGLLKPGQAVQVTPAGGAPVSGKLRMVAPTVDAATRNALVYVDLPASAGAAVKAGMFARGEFEIGERSGATLPATAVQLRDGFATAFTVEADSKVRQRKLQVGRRVGERIEVLSGLEANARVVVAGGAFLADGDTVRVTTGAAPAGQPAAPAKPASK